MSTNLAQTLFKTGPNDLLAAVNVYTQQSAIAPINDSANAILADIDALKGLAGCEAIAAETQIRDLVSSQKQALVSSDIVKGVISANSGLHTAYSSLSPKLQNFLTSVKGSVDLSMVNGKIKAGLKMSSMTDAGAVTAMINIVGGKNNSFTLKDISGQRTFVSNLLKLSSTIGVPGAYATAMAGIADKSMGRGITRDILPTVIANSSYEMLREIAEGPHADHVRATYPNVNRDFASSFKFSHDATTDQHANIAASILTSFNILNPNWNKTRTSKGRSYLNGSISLNSSGDFKAVLKASGNGYGGFRYSVTGRYAGTTIPEVDSPKVVKHVTLDSRGRPIVRYEYPNGVAKKYYTGNDGDLQEETSTPQVLPTNPTLLRNIDNSAIENIGTLCHVVNDADNQSRLLGGSLINTDASASLKNTFPLTALDGLRDMSDSWFS